VVPLAERRVGQLVAFQRIPPAQHEHLNPASERERSDHTSLYLVLNYGA
jgi:hypothetical protein